MAGRALNVLGGVVREQRRAWVLWSVAVAAVAALYIAVYPSMETMDLDAMMEGFPEGLMTALGYDDMSSAPGYISSTVYGLLGPALLLVFTLGLGARLLAGQEEDGTLELELAAPVSRRRLFLERLAALWLGTLILVAVITATSILLVLALDIEVDSMGLLAGGVGLLLLTGGLGTVAYGLGAATGRRSLALSAGAGVAVLAYILNAIGPLLEAPWMTAVSPFGWYLEGEPLTEGLILWRLALLAAVPMIFAGVGLVRFRRRNLMV